MAKKLPPPRGKALDLWTAPPEAGEPLVCVASSFTFDATFFETECVGRFLRMDNHPAESDAVAYLIEREEKLAATKVCALVDRRHATDKESFRWDIIGVLVPRANQHSKVSLLVWGNHVRVIIGSGNLTEPGYRKNVEIFGTIELSRALGGDLDSVRRTIDFLESVLAIGVGVDEADSPKRRAAEALAAARRHIARWPNVRSSDEPIPVFGAPRRGALAEMLQNWPGGGPAREAVVLSPFFDVAHNAPGTVNALVEGMAKRGDRSVLFCVRADSVADGRTRVHMPKETVTTIHHRCNVEVRTVLPLQDDEVRPLHAKLIGLRNDSWTLLMTGSSNFTAAGLTAATGGSFEANLLYRARTSDRPNWIESLLPALGDEPFAAESPDLIWDPLAAEPEDGAANEVPLPRCFKDAVYMPGADPHLMLHLDEGLPSSWEVRVPGGALLISGRDTNPGAHRISWTEPNPPFVLSVSWDSDTGHHIASWPVNVANPGELPPPEALRNLRLEELLAILSSTRPVPQAVAEILRHRSRQSAKPDELLDPLRRLDSPTFLLRRTRRVAAALDRLRDRLERPALSQDAFRWRLYGPVGVLALADAFAVESRLPGEARFNLAELALALHRVDPAKVSQGGLAAKVVADLLAEAIEQIRRRANDLPSQPDQEEMDRYVTAAFAEALRA